jgi:DNA-binding CsgD family transcriptional regulator
MVAANRVFLQMTDHDETTRALPRPGEGSPRRIMALIAFQAFCSAYFVVDVFEDFRGGGIEWWHVLPELAATAGLFVGIVFEVKVLRQLLRRQAIMEKSLAVAAGALAGLMEDYFRQWELTQAEAEVATFTIKGFSIAEVAQMRGTAEGTVKTHLNAIYRKAGVQGRGQLVSVLIEDLLNTPLVGTAGRT